MEPANGASLLERYPLPFEATTSDIYLHQEDISANTTFLPHSHAWGQLNVVVAGVMEISVDGRPFLSPPQYAIWIPPLVEHTSYSRQRVSYRALYLCPELSAQLPQEACMIRLSGVFWAIIEDFADRKQEYANSEADRRLAQVMVDQLAKAEPMVAYLPLSEDPLIKPILTTLQLDPADKRTLSQWAAQVYSTERTLNRHFQRKLGMSFSDWRQRRRFLASLGMLRSGMKVNQVALELGYSSPSAFITMFSRLSGTTPEQYRIQRSRQTGA
ncbi:AraC-type DNA-binding protein [Ferrimonas sediminum]|uniref:AraC-type DNA-binding protein n=1 Tax=Ferrimonas sediminum TaxID=718193 RepID=A0A1G8VNJ7_9GAMM|nr:helix-turn-helix transcriptional regulator [Ferrimonas sediminum]SDJ67646.1 AraC-type DNA-binding protein [Ferrimonas sediminum]